ncbi:hypothetical protein ACJX0J_034356, partial [Zea mays]
SLVSWEVIGSVGPQGMIMPITRGRGSYIPRRFLLPTIFEYILKIFTDALVAQPFHHKLINLHIMYVMFGFSLSFAATSFTQMKKQEPIIINKIYTSKSNYHSAEIMDALLSALSGD